MVRDFFRPGVAIDLYRNVWQNNDIPEEELLDFLKNFLNLWRNDMTQFVRNLKSENGRNVQKLPSVERLNELFQYQPETGELIYKINRRGNAKAGSIAGTIDKSSGYRRISVDGKQFRAHRLVWKMLKNEEPPELVDHIDSDRANNRIDNLQEATHSQNLRKQERETIRYHNGEEIPSGIRIRGTQFSIQFSISSYWRADYQTAGTIIRLTTDSIDSAIGLIRAIYLVENGDEFVKALNLNVEDRTILDQLYSGEIQKTYFSIRFTSFTDPVLQADYDQTLKIRKAS